MSFWKGFENQTRKATFKRHVILFCWDGSASDVKKIVDKARLIHPTVKVKAISDGTKLMAHRITELPTIVLLKNGREVDRLSGMHTKNQSLVDQLFRKAGS